MRLRQLGSVRRDAGRPVPPAEQVDLAVARELETGSFAAIDPETGEFEAVEPDR